MEAENLRHRPTSEEINTLPLRAWEGESRLIRTPEQWREALPLLCADGIVGFDTETKPSFRKGRMNAPALVQLAGPELVCLVQLGWLRFGPHCASLLANPDIIKVGVGIGDDLKALAKLYPFKPASFVDLGLMAEHNGLPNHGLRTLAASLFGWRISKGSRCSNWNARQLAQRQIKYAATDAWIGRMIYLRFRELGLAHPEESA